MRSGWGTKKLGEGEAQEFSWVDAGQSSPEMEEEPETLQLAPLAYSLGN